MRKQTKYSGSSRHFLFCFFFSQPCFCLFFFCFLPPLFCDKWPGLLEISPTFSFSLQPLRLGLFLYLVTSIKLLFSSFLQLRSSLASSSEPRHRIRFSFFHSRRRKGKGTRPGILSYTEKKKKGGGEFIREKGRRARREGIVDRRFKHGNSGKGSKKYKNKDKNGTGCHL